jgi:hypothetical protein
MPHYSHVLGLGVLLVVGALIIVGGLAAPLPARSQADGCPQLVDDALDVIGSACAAVGQNEACYGHTLVAATFQEGASDTHFESVGDLAGLADVQVLVTKPANPATGDWGLALLKVQANLPDTETMTFVLVGDTEISNMVDPSPADLPTCLVTNLSGNINVRGGPGTDRPVVDVMAVGQTATANGRNAAGDWLRIILDSVTGWVYAPLVEVDCPVETLTNATEGEAAPIYTRPMQAFTLHSGTGGVCEEAPNGLLIASPAGRRARVMVNSVQLEFSSAAFLTAQPDGDLSISGLNGVIFVTAYDKTVAITPGFETKIPLTGLTASGPPREPVQVQDVVKTVPELVVVVTNAYERDDTGTTSSASSGSSSQTVTITVPAAMYDWVDTGLTIRAGQTFSVFASGTINIWNDCEETKAEYGYPQLDCSLSIADSNGTPLRQSIGLPMDEFPLPKALEGALIARIGGGLPFFVGEEGSFTADTDGALQFRINNAPIGGILNDEGTFVVVVVLSG